MTKEELNELEVFFKGCFQILINTISGGFLLLSSIISFGFAVIAKSFLMILFGILTMSAFFILSFKDYHQQKKRGI